MKIASLKTLKVDDLNLLYVDAVKKWAEDPTKTEHSDLAQAIADELERRGKDAPTDQVKAEIQILVDLSLDLLETQLRR